MHRWPTAVLNTLHPCPGRGSNVNGVHPSFAGVSVGVWCYRVGHNSLMRCTPASGWYWLIGVQFGVIKNAKSCMGRKLHKLEGCRCLNNSGVITESCRGDTNVSGWTNFWVSEWKKTSINLPCVHLIWVWNRPTTFATLQRFLRLILGTFDSNPRFDWSSGT